MADQPLTHLAQRINDRMDEMGLSIKDVADRTESTYEHIRKIVRGGSFPSKYMIRVLSEVLEIPQKELLELTAADQIRNKYGKIPLLLSGKNPELEPVEKLWPQLTKEQRESFVAQMSAVARKNKKASA